MRAVRRSWRGPVTRIEVVEPRIVLAAPTAMGGSDTMHMNSALTSMASAYDSDMDPITLSVVTGASNGTVSMDSGGSFTYTPNPNFVGSDSFTFKANDGTSDSNIATFTITVGNTAPTANSGSDSTFKNTPLSSMVSAFDSDMDPLTVTVVGGPRVQNSISFFFPVRFQPAIGGAVVRR